MLCSCKLSLPAAHVERYVKRESTYYVDVRYSHANASTCVQYHHINILHKTLGMEKETEAQAKLIHEPDAFKEVAIL